MNEKTYNIEDERTTTWQAQHEKAREINEKIIRIRELINKIRTLHFHSESETDISAIIDSAERHCRILEEALCKHFIKNLELEIENDD